VAYALFPALAAFMVRGGRAALAVMGAAALCFYAWVAATTGVLDIVKGAAVLRCLAGFSLGMILYATRAQVDRLSDATLGVLQAAGAVIAIGTPLLGLNDVAAIPGFFLLVAATWPDRGWLTRPLRTPLLHWLGEISYSVYLNHFWVLAAWHFVMSRVLRLSGVPPLAGRAVILVGGVALVLAASHCTYRYIEGRRARRSRAGTGTGRQRACRRCRPARARPEGRRPQRFAVEHAVGMARSSRPGMARAV
jgi:peptidoglycan/LPS O-acetylase OafA/YrhL